MCLIILINQNNLNIDSLFHLIDSFTNVLQTIFIFSNFTFIHIVYVLLRSKIYIYFSSKVGLSVDVEGSFHLATFGFMAQYKRLAGRE